jgi:hypothetical protein
VQKKKQIDINHTQEGIGPEPVGQGEQWDGKERGDMKAEGGKREHTP